jgi:hypothetical protein
VEVPAVDDLALHGHGVGTVVGTGEIGERWGHVSPDLLHRNVNGSLNMLIVGHFKRDGGQLTMIASLV